MNELLQSPIYVFFAIAVPLVLTQLWLHQREASLIRRALWVLGILVGQVFGFIAFYIVEMLPAQKRDTEEAERNKQRKGKQ